MAMHTLLVGNVCTFDTLVT